MTMNMMTMMQMTTMMQTMVEHIQIVVQVQDNLHQSQDPFVVSPSLASNV